MPENDKQFEFELENGQKVFTGMQMPETRPLMFAESTAQAFTIDEVVEMLGGSNRMKSRQLFPSISNQGRRSSCNAYAAEYALEKARAVSGHEQLELAPEYLYALINDGQDRGSMLHDGMRALCEKGMPPRDMVPYESYRMSDMSIEAKRVAMSYRGHECEQMPTQSVEDHWAMMISSILRKQFIVTAVHVGNRFMKLDQRGICGVDRGAGNHAVSCDDVAMLTDSPRSWSDFALDMSNSWGTQWGDNGRGLLTINHSEEPMKWHASYNVRSVTTDPNATNPFVKA